MSTPIIRLTQEGDVPNTAPKIQLLGAINTPSSGFYTTEENEAGGVSYSFTAEECESASNVKEKDVNFYDYDGTLLHSYTVEEAQALSELPELPTQKGLICQGWNWTLEDIKAHNRALDIGATYITDDGKTRLYIKIAAEGRMDVPLYFYQSVANGVTIDWGDGSATQTLDGTGNVNTTHTYASIGEYVISLEPVDGCELGFGNNSQNCCVIGLTKDNEKVYCNMLQKVELGKGVVGLRQRDFCNCFSLVSITIPNSVTSIGNYVFYCCYSLASIVIPNSVMSITSSLFEKCYGMKFIDFSQHESVHTLSSTSAFSGISSDCEIRVPAALVDEWKAATNWSAWADYIVGV